MLRVSDIPCWMTVLEVVPRRVFAHQPFGQHSAPSQVSLSVRRPDRPCYKLDQVLLHQIAIPSYHRPAPSNLLSSAKLSSSVDGLLEKYRMSMRACSWQADGGEGKEHYLSCGRGDTLVTFVAPCRVRKKPSLSRRELVGAGSY